MHLKVIQTMAAGMNECSRDLNPSHYYRAYGRWLKQKYHGKQVYKVIADAGFTCPNRDGSKGYGGCSYCNVDSFTPSLTRSLPSIKEQLLASMARAKGRYKAEQFIVYFQPNTNTYAPVEQLEQLYREALEVNQDETVGLSVGTRPDCLDPAKISLLESFTDRYDVDLELGMESIHESTLAQINRGCSHQELVDQLDALKDSPLRVGVHMIFGFPWESQQQMLAYADEVNRHPAIRFVKLHHLHLVRGSILGTRYLKQPFPVFSLDQYTDFLADFLPRLRPDIVIQRLFGVADSKLLIAPDWKLPKAAVQNHIDRAMQARGIIQGSAL